FFIEQLDVLCIELRGLNRHWTVDIDGKCRKRAALESPGKEIEKYLCSSDGEDRDQNLGAGLHCFLDDLPCFARGFFQRTMVAVAVSGFHEDEVSRLERDVVAVQRSAARTKIAREDHDLFHAFIINRHFQAHRPEHVPRLDGAEGDPGGQRRCFIVAKLLVEGAQALHVWLFVEWIKQRLSHPLPPTVFPFYIRLLQVGGVFQNQVGKIYRGRRRENRPGIARAG